MNTSLRRICVAGIAIAFLGAVGPSIFKWNMLAYAAGTIYIRADGSIDPPSTPISGDGTRYNFTGDISGEIVVQRSNIIIDGNNHTLQGSGTGTGFSLTGRSNVAIWRTTILNFASGIVLDYSRDNRITTNDIRSNGVGIKLYGSLSTNNTVLLNWITSNDVGVEVDMMSASNLFYYNTFLTNGVNARVGAGATNSWDNPSGLAGNYWSNYTGVDIYPFVGGDGIGDTPHVINANNVDYNPWMGPVYHIFEMPVGDEWGMMIITCVSNSPRLEAPQSYTGPGEYDITAVGFNVTGPDGTSGFCRVALPHMVMQPPYNVTINGLPIVHSLLFENETLSIIYFTYTHSTKRVEIVSTAVIPEFPSFTIAPLFLIASLFAIALKKKAHSKHTEKPAQKLFFRKLPKNA